MYLDPSFRRIEVNYVCATCGSYLAAPGARDMVTYKGHKPHAATCNGCGTIGPRVAEAHRAVPAFVAVCAKLVRV